MYVNEGRSDIAGFDGYNSYGPDKWSTQQPPPAPPTSIPLDDNFDAMTADAPTEWNIGLTQHRDYEESVSGLRNYVVDMERKLSGEDDYYPSSPRAVYTNQRSSYTDNNSLQRARPSGARKSLPPMPLPDNARKVSGQRGKIELVEQKIMEDGPSRTISLWRERVAQSSAGDGSQNSDDVRSDTNSRSHRRMRSDDSHVRKVVSGGQSGSGDSSTRSTGAGKEMELRRLARASYERSEYMVAYHQPSRHGYPVALYPQSEVGSVTDKHGMGSPLPSARLQRRPSEAPLSPLSPIIRRVSSRHLGERSEYMVSYSHTPQHSCASVMSSVSPQERKMIEPPSPVSAIRKKSMLGPRSNNASSLTGATSSSSVELILSSCEPSLLHIAPVLADLGIQRLEHLRALGRLSEETRDREIKEQALKRGVTMVEWAILLDRLHSL